MKSKWIFFAGLYLVFLYPLVLLKKGFVLGDYELQFYPWAFLYSESLKQGFLPLWTDAMQSGFPLFAEGQTGMLYLLNLLLFKFLPFRAAYNGMFLLHFAMGGWFMALFARKRGLTPPAATLAALLFTFGSAYAGCFYNIVTMRSLVWFPLMLYCVEVFLERKTPAPLWLLAFAASQSWLAGFPQLAAYACFFVLTYFGLRLAERGDLKGRRLRLTAGVVLSLALSMLVALPQIGSTWEFSQHSTRLLQEKSFALWGSVPPWAFVVLFFFPWSAFLKVSLYIGVLPLFCVLGAPRDREIRIYVWLVLLSFLLAMGVYNPLSWLWMHLPGMSLLRNPAKFLFFTAFFLTMIAARSFDAWRLELERGERGWERRFFPRTLYALFALAGLAFSAWVIAHFGQEWLRAFGEWYVRHFVLNRSYHRRSWAEYSATLDGTIAMLRHALDARKPFFWVPFLWCLAFAALLKLASLRKVTARALPSIFLLMVACDLYLYGSHFGTGFIGNVGPFPDPGIYDRYERDGKWLDALRGERRVFPPNRNLLSGHASVGAYSPLLDKEYALLTRDFGDLDDAFGRTRFSKDFFLRSKALQDFLGLKYLVLDEDFGAFELPEGWRLLRREAGTVIYRNENAATEFTLEPAGSGRLTLLRREGLAARLETESPEPQTLVRNQTFDAGWKAWVDGRPARLFRARGAFQGLPVPAGRHRVELAFQPDSFMIGRWFYGFGLLFIAIGGACSLWKKRFR